MSALCLWLITLPAVIVLFSTETNSAIAFPHAEPHSSRNVTCKRMDDFKTSTSVDCAVLSYVQTPALNSKLANGRLHMRFGCPNLHTK
ncbi:hypothetical protein BDP81DRAFT_432251 [Colletotrichum phormii]|uniref:Secreted protein n=1 Tax=Colletotrichum phormii TaxID=359342 RepID=A0AAI9ZQM0_9PEZI|nr:uncharacterized protein BDP81DRAFT_432251 [Colletotrichum phormii]KAK1634922.1 hypothetical protein BDP81DRAFT_432251 [Colletotrichum phormii]